MLLTVTLPLSALHTSVHDRGAGVPSPLLSRSQIAGGENGSRGRKTKTERGQHLNLLTKGIRNAPANFLLIHNTYNQYKNFETQLVGMRVQ